HAGDDVGVRVRASRDGGSTFAPPVTAFARGRGDAVVGSDGRLHTVALIGSALGAFGSAHHTVEYAASVDGGASFRSRVRVSGHDELLPFHFARPAIAIDTRRKWIYVAYVRGGRDAAWDIVLATSKDGGSTWKRTRLAGDGCAIHMVP